MAISLEKKFFYFFHSLSVKERVYFLTFLFIFLLSSFFLLRFFYLTFTISKPAQSGVLREGFVGFPQLSNPVLSQFQEPDIFIHELIFPSLFVYQSLNITPSFLVENYEILDDGKTVNVQLKKDVFWSDRKPLTVDDVIFTIETIQNPDIKSPLFSSWVGIKVKKISQDTIQFQLKDPSSFFLENLTFKILPKHFFEKFSVKEYFYSQNLLFSPSAGPYQIKNFEYNEKREIKKIEFERNERYAGKKPYLDKIVFYFYPSEEKLIYAFERGEVDHVSFSHLPEWFEKKAVKRYSFILPRYFALFFNLENDLFKEESVRSILSLAINKREVLKKTSGNDGLIVHSLLFPAMVDSLEKKDVFDIEKARELIQKENFVFENGLWVKRFMVEKGIFLKEQLKIGSVGNQVKGLQACLSQLGFFDGEINGIFDRKTQQALIAFQEKYKEEVLAPANLKKPTGTLGPLSQKKLNSLCFRQEEKTITLSFTITTLQDPVFLSLAQSLKEQWERIGVKVEIKTINNDELKQDIIPRKDYEALLIGQIFRFPLDLYPFWHSSQNISTGLNLSNYTNQKVDVLLEEVRKIFNEKERLEKIKQAQEMILNDKPLILLFSPYYFCFTNGKIKGVKEGVLILPSDRFLNIQDYYTKEKRVFSFQKTKEIIKQWLSSLKS